MTGGDLLAGLTSGDHSDALVRVGPARWTFADLLVAASDLRASIAAYDRVAVHATASGETVLAVVACLLAGVEVVPVAPDAGTRERAHVLRDSGAQAWWGQAPPPHQRGDLRVVAGASVSAEAPHLAVPDDSEGAENAAATEATGLPAERGRDAARTALVLYTSGTTGLPKGVVLSRGAIAACVDALLVDAWGWTPADTVAHGLPLFHAHGLIFGVLGALRVGAGVHHVGKPTPQAYATAAEEGATVFFGVPTIWSRIADDADHAAALAPARLLVSGSAPLPTPVFDRIEALTGHRIVERYGSSETLITIATRADAIARAGWVGVPIVGVETRIRQDPSAASPGPATGVGSLEVRGPTLFDGYLHRPEADAAAWTDDGWFRTGDLAVVDDDGWHRIVGRESVDLIKSGGYRIGAGEIETALLAHPGVGEVAVVGEPDADLGQRIVAYVVVRDPADAREAFAEELVTMVGAELNAHKRPREVRFTDALPRNAMGKVQKKLLLPNA